MAETDKEKYLLIDNMGQAPHVPKSESPTLSDDYTLVMMVRETLQSGEFPTRGSLAFAELVKRMRLQKPKLPLDPQPYLRPDGERSESKKGVYPEFYNLPDEDGGGPDEDNPHPNAGQEWEANFAPRFEYSQDRADYNPGPSTIGWYDDPDGSGRERWWMGTVWADLYRDKPKAGRR